MSIKITHNVTQNKALEGTIELETYESIKLLTTTEHSAQMNQTQNFVTLCDAYLKRTFGAHLRNKTLVFLVKIIIC